MLRSARDSRGRFVHPWPTQGAPRGLGDLLRWQLQRLRHGRPPTPPPAAFRTAAPDPALPRTAPGELRITCIGHATFLIQISGVNVLTDPIWSRRASPVSWAGPARLAAPGMSFDALPDIDLVLISHDHYDHLDARTIRRLARRHGELLQWVAPLGFRRWFDRLGITTVTELDWWDAAHVSTAGGSLEVTAAPAQHWSKRSPFSERRRLWASFRVAGPDGSSAYFGGDSGWFDGFSVIGRELGPFAAALLPIGAYEPRWFMQSAHMNPEEAVAAWCELGGAGIFVGMHWGTFRLTDEPPLEPPERTRAAWAGRGLPPAALWLPRPGETRIVRTMTTTDPHG